MTSNQLRHTLKESLSEPIEEDPLTRWSSRFTQPGPQLIGNSGHHPGRRGTVSVANCVIQELQKRKEGKMLLVAGEILLGLVDQGVQLETVDQHATKTRCIDVLGHAQD